MPDLTLQDIQNRALAAQGPVSTGNGWYYDASTQLYIDSIGRRYQRSPSGAMVMVGQGTVPTPPSTDTTTTSAPRTTTSTSGGGAAAPAADAWTLDQYLGAADKLAPPVNPPPAPTYNTPSPQPRVTHAQEDPAVRQAAENSAYASAKDRIGAQGRASIDALRDEFSGRGFGAGSDMEGAATARIIGETNGQMGQVARDISAADLARMNSVADQTYTGNINQRTADQAFGETTAAVPYQGAITTRGQDITAQADQGANRRASLQTLAALKSSGLLY